MQKYYFIINPAAGRGRHLSFLSELPRFFSSHNKRFEMALTKEPGHAIHLAQKAAGNFEAVVAVGGDGTINEVVNGLVGTDTLLGILPTGSGNDYSREVGLVKNIKKDLRKLIRAQHQKIDIGRVNHSRYFVNGLGVGFDGEVAGRVKHFLKYSRGFSAYLLAVLRTLATYRFREATITLDDAAKMTKQVLLVATCIGTTYGGGFQVAPSAKINDGVFTICQVDKVGRLYALRHLAKFKRGTHIKLPEVHMYTSKRVIIESPYKLPAQIDGELLQPENRYEITMHPKHLSVIT